VAFQAENVREWYLEQARSQLKPAELAYLHARIEAILENGYEMVEGRLLPGVVDISFPILDSNGTALAAVTVPYLSTYGTPKPLAEVVGLLHEAADTICMAMGGQLAPLDKPIPAPGPRLDPQ